MGCDYFVYIEGKVNNKWKCLNGYIKNIKENLMELSPSYYNGSRSYFGNTYNKLMEIGNKSTMSTLSDEIINDYRKYFDNEEELNKTNVILIPLSVFNEAIPKEARYDKCGYVPKDEFFSFVTGCIDEFETCFSVKEFLELNETEKDGFVYAEWNDPTGWLIHFKDIKKAVDINLKQWDYTNYSIPEEIRLVVYASY